MRLLGTALLFLLLSPHAVHADEAAPRRRMIVTVRVPVEADAHAAAATLPRAAAIHSSQQAVLDRLTSGEAEVYARWSAVPGFAALMTDEGVLRLQADPAVVSVQPDRGGTGHLAQSVPLVHGDVVRSLGFTGTGVTVAIIDTGVHRAHIDLQDAVIDEACFCTNADGSGCCPGGGTTQFGVGAANDDNEHGSNVTGIVASRGLESSYGVAPGASIVAVKVLDHQEVFAFESTVISALDWVIDNKPDVKVINMSLGTDELFAGNCDADATVWASAINTLKARGTMVFASAGNQSSHSTMAIPACVQNTIAVGAVYDANFGTSPVFGCNETTHADKITCFSNVSTTLDLLAPGARITSDGNASNIDLSTYYGTSQASPHAAGTAALLFAAKPSLTPDQVEATLKSTGVPIFDARIDMTFPRINIEQAMYATLPCTLTVTSPNGGEGWQFDHAHNITWQKSGLNCGANVKVELYKGGVLSSTIVATTANDGSFSWMIPASQQEATDYTVKIIDLSNASISDTSDATFAIGALCTINVTFPTRTDTFFPGNSYDLAWTKSSLCGNAIQIDLFKGGLLYLPIVASTASDGSYLWLVPSAPSGSDYRIRILDPTTSASALSEDSFTITGAPSSLAAALTGTQPPQILVTWTSTGTAGQYRLLRRGATTGFVEIGRTGNTSMVDSAVQSSQAYIYTVQRIDSTGNFSASSNAEPATTYAFTDSPLSPGVMVKLAHILELRNAVNALRAAAGLGAFTFTDGPPDVIRAIHITQLRSALDAARAAIPAAPMSYSESVAAGTTIKSVHYQEIRTGVQ